MLFSFSQPFTRTTAGDPVLSLVRLPRVAARFGDLESATPGPDLSVEGFNGPAGFFAAGKVHKQVVAVTRKVALFLRRGDDLADGLAAYCEQGIVGKSAKGR